MSEDKDREIGAGCPDGSGGSGASGCRADVQALINSSPRLALALAQGRSFVPYVFTITGTFSTAGNPGASTDNLASPANINQDLLVENIDVDIQTPNFDTGDVLKPQADWYYNATSGIQVSMRILGFGERGTPYFPLKALPSLGVQGAGGPTFGSMKKPWVVLADQEVALDFAVTTALPSSSTIITVTFVCSVCYPMFTNMDQGRACDALDKMGYCTGPARKQFACEC